MRGFQDRAEVADAVALLRARLRPLPAEACPLPDAARRVLAADVVAAVDVPGFDRAAMDGYALRGGDTFGAGPYNPIELALIGETLPGRPFAGAVGPNQAVRIMTGAPLPAGADAVAPVEDTTRGDAWVEVHRPQGPGVHIRHAGEDLQLGQRLVAAGQGLRPGDLGALAAAGLPVVAVHPRVRVAVLTTGDELVDAAEEPGPGRIRDANIHAVGAQVAACGAVPLPFPRVPDDRATLRAVLRQALAADAVLTTGGISVGDYDFMKDLLEELGAVRLFWKVAQKPGGPLGVWMLGDTPIFGIPGNPVAAMLMVEEFVRPALRRMMGFARLHRPVAQARLEGGWRGRSGDPRTTFLRVVARREGDRLSASLTGPQGSAILSSMLLANALAVIPPGVDQVEPGGTVQLHLTEEAEDH